MGYFPLSYQLLREEVEGLLSIGNMLAVCLSSSLLTYCTTARLSEMWLG